MYKQASQLGLRFTTSKGALTTEQLWQLSQTELANCIKNAKKALNKNEDSDLDFLDNKTSVDPVAQLRFDILKDVYLTKQTALEAVRDAKARKESNQKIFAIIASKQEQELHGKSIEELEKMIQ